MTTPPTPLWGLNAIPDTIQDYEAQVYDAYKDNNDSCWRLGDLFNIGRNRFGEDHAQVFDPRQKSLATIKNYANVCRKIPYGERTYNVSFSHYREVRNLDPVDRADLLAMAERDELSRDDLRDIVQSKDGKDEPLKAQGIIQLRALVDELQANGFDADMVIEFNVKEYKEVA